MEIDTMAQSKVKEDPIEGRQDAHVGAGAADPKLEADRRPALSSKRPGRPARGTHSLATQQGPLVERPDESHASSGVERKNTHRQEQPKLAFQKVSSFDGFVGSVIGVVELAAPAIERKVTLSGSCDDGLFIYANNAIEFIPFHQIQSAKLKSAE